MPDDEYIDDDEQDEQPSVPKQMRDHMKDLERQNREAQERLAAFEQKDLIRSAGIDATDRQVKALLAAHDGEMTADALRETAKDLGFISDQRQQSANTEPSAEEIAAHQRIVNASAGAHSPDTTGDPRAQLLDEVRNNTLSADQFWRRANELRITNDTV